MVKRVMEQGMSPRRVAEQLGVNASTVYKWLRRYREGGLAALPDRSSRPHRSPRWPPAPPAAAWGFLGPGTPVFLARPTTLPVA